MMSPALVLAAALLAPAVTSPLRLAPAARDSVTHAIEEARAQEQKSLKEDATSYLAAVRRVDFGEASTLLVGSAPDCGVHVDDPALPAHALIVAVAGDSFRVASLDPATPFRVRNIEVHQATVGPTSIQLGRFTLRLSHQRFPAIIVFDPQSPGLARYHGLSYFPVDLSYRFVAPLTPNPSPDTVIILSTRGNQRRALRVGWFDLRVAGRSCRLEAHRLLEPGVGESSVSVFFRDVTTGRETYEVGRYVDPEPTPDGRYVLDFNEAYNPACAFSPHYNCPIPTKANTLPVPVRAGERDSHYAH